MGKLSAAFFVGAICAIGGASASARPLVQLLGSRPAMAGPMGRVVLVDPVSGAPAGGAFQRWADEARIATVPGRLAFTSDISSLAGCDIGCSVGPPWYGPSPETAVSIAPAWLERYTLYFELGHQFAWRYLAHRHDRQRYLMRRWGISRAHWRDSDISLQHGSEDGGDAVFAAIYADCARGRSDVGVRVHPVGDPRYSPPPARPRIDTCAYADRIAARDDARPIPRAARSARTRAR